MLGLLQGLRRELNITLVLVTHDLAIAEQAERVIRLEDGRVAADSAMEGGIV